MPRDRHPGQAQREERGMTLVMVAFALVALLGFAALAIDLAFLYVARSEAQRAADAAALAGAKEFVVSSFLTGGVSQATAQTLATDAAIGAGSQNNVGGSSAVILPTDVTFDFSIANDPRITVTVARDAAHGGPLPTFFAKVLGVLSANVSAKATAEAYSPGNSGPPVGPACLKPWMLPNCDPNHANPANTSCPGSGAGKFVDTSCGPSAVCNGGPAPGGVIGTLLSIKSGNPSLANAPSKYYPVDLPIASQGMSCPACAGGGSSGGGIPSGSVYTSNISCCNLNPIPCGTKLIQPITGNKVGPTVQGVDCLIHQPGQDTLTIGASGYPVVPFQGTGGLNNPNPALQGQPITPSSSDSVVTIPLYDGSTLCPGLGSCGPATVDIVGFLQVFIKDEGPPSGTVEAYIMNVSGCGAGGNGPGSPPPITSTSSFPIRLIRNPGT